MRISDWSSDVCSSDLLECHWLRHSVSRSELRGVPAFDVLHGFAGKSEMLYLHAQMQFPYRLYTLIALRLHAGPVKPAFIIFVQHQIGEPAQRRIEDGFIMADMLLLDLGNLQIDRARHRVSGPIAA